MSGNEVSKQVNFLSTLGVSFILMQNTPGIYRQLAKRGNTTLVGTKSNIFQT